MYYADMVSAEIYILLNSWTQLLAYSTYFFLIFIYIFKVSSNLKTKYIFFTYHSIYIITRTFSR